MSEEDDFDSQLDPGEFDTQSEGAPDSFALGFFKINDLDCFPGTFQYDVGDSAALFFSLEEESLIATSHLFVNMYRLDRDRARFAEELADYTSSENHLGVSTRADPSALALAVPRGWKHQAFHSRSGPRRAIAHTYIGPDRAAIIRYLLNRPDIAEFPRFIEINDSLEWNLDSWIVQHDYVKLGPAAGISDTPLPDELRNNINAGIVRARHFLELPKLCTAAQIHQAIFDAVDRVISTNQPPRSQRSDLAFQLGSLWAHATASSLKWEWCIIHNGDQDTPALVSPDRSHYVAPLEFLKRQLNQSTSDETADNTTFLLYNMMMAAKLPPSSARRYLELR